MTAHDLLNAIGASSIKPLGSVLLLPPLPLLLLVAIGAWRLAGRHRRSGWTLLLLGLAALWLVQCQAVGERLMQTLLDPPPALAPADLEAMHQSARDTRRVIVVLGGGREPSAPEYAQSHLGALSMQRLHYAIYLARRIDAPILFSGGVGHAGSGEASEAEAAQRIAERDYGVRLRWIETASRDTRENARESLALLASERAIAEIVVVSHATHLPRALRAFSDVARAWPSPPKIVGAPIGEGGGDMTPTLRWLPSPAGARLVHSVLRERLGLALGA